MDYDVHHCLELSIVEHRGGDSEKKFEADVSVISLVDFFVFDIEDVGMSKGVVEFLVVVELSVAEFVVD